MDLENILQDHRGRLARIARQYGGGDWQDLLQEIRLALWKSGGSFEGRASIDTWVYRVALNTALSHVRKKRPEITGTEVPETLCSSSSARDPIRVLETFLRSLGTVNRAVLLMDLEGLTRHEIGEVLGLSPGAVAVRMTRLKQRFDQDYVESR
ncbi:MAG: sigma-70 family RNA polymerase sigma factor [Thermoanaerobaculia bacterium]|nr:sigma-70 family RNA polymerase sigma factor [Thermoanaerobaculia bacterium]